MRLKKINKTQDNNPLVQYAEDYPQNNWKQFRDDNPDGYKQVRKDMFIDQGGLCAYCETEVSGLSEILQRIEHYHSKSDDSDVNKNWALDWQNIFGVCVGGSRHGAGQKVYPLPQNLSCDAHKDALISRNKLAKACEGYLINPLDLISTPCLFGFNKANGKLFANEEACAEFELPYNQYASTLELVQKTIVILNLNCQRLKDIRLEVLKSYNREVAKARKANDRQGISKLAERWFNKKWPSHFTTRRILLDRHAEAYLQDIEYNG